MVLQVLKTGHSLYQQQQTTSFSGKVVYPNRTEVIVVTTGDIFGTENVTEILSLTDLTWRRGPDFPTSSFTYLGRSLPYRNSFLAMGGYQLSLGFLDDIWWFDPTSEDWTRLASLETPRSEFTAMFISDEEC